MNLKKLLKRNKPNKHIDVKWITIVFVIAFVISFLMSLVSELTLPKAPLLIAVLIVLIFIFIGIIFDMIGVAVTASDEKVFNSMNAKKIKGAHLAVKFKKNQDKVSSFCCDVIGDICGVISGAAISTVVILLVQTFTLDNFIITLLITALVASLTIGGKAIGKSIAINKSNTILYEFSKIISYIYK